MLFEVTEVQEDNVPANTKQRTNSDMLDELDTGSFCCALSRTMFINIAISLCFVVYKYGMHNSDLIMFLSAGFVVNL